MAESLFDRENWPEFSHITNPFSRRGKVQRSHGAALCDALVNDFRFNCQTACRHRASGQSRAQAKRSRIPRVLVPAARSARVLSNITLNEQRGQGMPDAWPHPQPRVKTKTTHEFSHHRLAETFRHSLRDGFTVSFALFPVIGLSCHRRLRINVRKLCISVEMPEPRDFAVREVRTRQLRTTRPSHPAPNVRDDRETPLFRVRDSRRSIAVSSKSRSEIFFRQGLDTTAKSGS